MNAPPPYSATNPGNLKKFPKPTALPATASMTPSRVFHPSFILVDIAISVRKLLIIKIGLS